MKQIKYILLFGLLTFKVLFVSAQALQHPTIWITQQEKEKVLQLAEQHQWAQSIIDQLHNRIDSTKNAHLKNPETILKSIPAFGGNMDEHNAVLTIAVEAGMLYFLTDDETYAQLSADIIAAYCAELAPRTPQTTEIMGDAFHDPRTTYYRLALAYDFSYNYLNKRRTKVYDKNTGKQVSFNNKIAQQAFKNIIGNILQEYGKPDKHGSIISNHPILTATGALFTILCIDDAKERERLFNVFWETGTNHQSSFKHTILPMFSGQGIWPESLSYSFMPNICMVLNIVDRIKPEMNVTKDYMHIFNGNFIFTNLRIPDRRFVRYGDSKRNNDFTEKNYRYALHIADRKGYTELKQKALVALKQTYISKGGRTPIITDGAHDNSCYLELFWGIPIPEMEVDAIDYKPTVIVEHAGIALQRNYVKENNESYGLCGIIGGAHYVHSHCTGITMELYGANYVMAPNAGLPPTVEERRIPLHENYFRLYAGNNTVIVNGTSHGRQEGSWKDEAYVWQNTAVNIAAEPKHLEDPISSNFSFATQFLKDEINNCDQERTLSTIRTSPTTAYYLDIFRSKSLDENKFHDYIYHNIGDETTIKTSNNKVLPLTTTNWYDNDIGDPVQSPGWRYFEDEQATAPTSASISISFKIKADNKYMNMFVPSGIERAFTKAIAPPTREAEGDYINKKTQVIAIRQTGEAWKRPFITVIEPSNDKSTAIRSVEYIYDGDKIVGAKVLSHIKDEMITDIIIAQENATSVYDNPTSKLKFEGRFAIVRKVEKNDKTQLTLYIGEGKSLTFEGEQLLADETKKGIKTLDIDKIFFKFINLPSSIKSGF